MITFMVMILFLIVFHNPLFAIAEMVFLFTVRVLMAILYVITLGRKGYINDKHDDNSHW